MPESKGPVLSRGGRGSGETRAPAPPPGARLLRPPEPGWVLGGPGAGSAGIHSPARRLWLRRCQPALPYSAEAGAQGRGTQRIRQNHVTFDDLRSHVVSLPPPSPGQGNVRGQPGFKGREGRCLPSVGARRPHSVRRAGRRQTMNRGLRNVHCTGFLSTGEPLIPSLNWIPLK